MRVSPRDLKAVRAGGILTRYAVLGDAVFVIVELPTHGSAGTVDRGAVPARALGPRPPGRPAARGAEATGLRAGDGVLRAARPAPPLPRRRRGGRRRVRAGDRSPFDDSPEALRRPGHRGRPPGSRPRTSRRPRSGSRAPRTRAAATGKIQTSVGGHGRLAVHAVGLRPAQRLRRGLVRPPALGPRPRRRPRPALGGRRDRAARRRGTRSTAPPGRRATGSRWPTPPPSSTTRRSPRSTSRSAGGRRE